MTKTKCVSLKVIRVIVFTDRLLLTYTLAKQQIMFIYSLPPLFAYTDLILPLELILFLALIFGAVSFAAPKPDNLWINQKHPNLYLILQACWFGQSSLSRAFWPFFILVNLVFFYIDYRISNVTFTIASTAPSKLD
jgi:hypothetical protein